MLAKTKLEYHFYITHLPAKMHEPWPASVTIRADRAPILVFLPQEINEWLNSTNKKQDAANRIRYLLVYDKEDDETTCTITQPKI